MQHFSAWSLFVGVSNSYTIEEYLLQTYREPGRLRNMEDKEYPPPSPPKTAMHRPRARNASNAKLQNQITA